MLRLDLSRKPKWRDIGHGVRLLCAPVTASLMAEARLSPGVAALAPEIAEDGQPTRQTFAQRDALGLAFAHALAPLVVQDWEGVGDAEGAALAFSPEGLLALLELPPLLEGFQVHVVAPVLLLSAEKNVSAPSPNGISAGAPATASETAAPAATTARRARTRR